MDLDNKFSLDVFRSHEERILMVQDADCPVEVRRIVAEHDLDPEVLFALWVVNLKYNDEITNKWLVENLKMTADQLQKKYNDWLSKNTPEYSVFCSLPWNHVSTNADGSLRMCCQMIEDHAEYPYGSLFDDSGNVITTDADLSTMRNAPGWKDIRKQMLQGIDPEICKLCTNEENNGIGSKRDWSKLKYPKIYNQALELTQEDGSIKDEDFPITYYDLRFGNKCNLKCRSCGPTDSNLWYEDWYNTHDDHKFDVRGHGNVEIIKKEDGTFTVPDVFDWHETEENTMWSNIITELPNIDRFYFTGGEPTINIKHRKLLQICIDLGLSKNIHLDYNTNMAGIPGSVFQQWKHFKSVGLGMSIDGIYEHFEYIRNPGRWKTVEKNLNRIEKEENFNNLSAAFTLTLSTMNVLHVLDMIWWMLEQDWKKIDKRIVIHNLYGPEHLNIQNLPEDAKIFVQHRYKQFIDVLNQKYGEPDEIAATHTICQRLQAVLDHMFAKEHNPEIWKKWFIEADKYDKQRKEDWRKTMPEIVELLKETNEKNARRSRVKLAKAGKK
jgi:organic radical activating enzyme